MQFCSSLNILWHCLSLGLEWKLTLSSPVAIAEFSMVTPYYHVRKLSYCPQNFFFSLHTLYVMSFLSRDGVCFPWPLFSSLVMWFALVNGMFTGIVNKALKWIFTGRFFLMLPALPKILCSSQTTNPRGITYMESRSEPNCQHVTQVS